MEKTKKKATRKKAQEKNDKCNNRKARFKVSDKRFWVNKENKAELKEFQEEHLYPTFVEELKAKKEESEKKLLEYIQAFKKMQMEQEEFRARLRKDIDNKVNQRKKELFLKLLDTLDNLDRAISSAKNNESNSRLLEGVRLSRDHFLSILKSEGIERIDTLGKKFDPKIAEAIMVVKTENPSKINIVIEEIIPGYSFRDQILRPAKVKVGIEPTSSKEETKEEKQ